MYNNFTCSFANNLKSLITVSSSGTGLHVHEDKEDKKKSPAKPKGKLVACGECEGCKRKACKKCDKCTAKPKKRCALRICTDMRRVPDKEDKKKSGKKRGKKKKKKGSDDEDSASGEEESKPKIRIKLSASKAGTDKKKPAKKRKATPKKEPEENGNAKKKARRSPSDEEEDEMFNVDSLQAKHDSLEQTWQTAREFATKLGPWRLPPEVESEFKEVAKLTIINLAKADEYDIFAEPVDADEVEGYDETITNPMDFSTMKSKAEKGMYGEGSEAAAKLYEDFLLVFDNCFTFNHGEGEVVDEAMLILKAMSLTFAKVCQEVKRMQGPV